MGICVLYVFLSAVKRFEPPNALYKFLLLLLLLFNNVFLLRLLLQTTILGLANMLRLGDISG